MASSAARPLQDQKALLTGGSSGIGAASARALARAGAAVGVNYCSKASAADGARSRDPGSGRRGRCAQGRRTARYACGQNAR